MQDQTIMGLLGFVGALAVVVTPIIKLNINITKLNSNFENMMNNDKIRDQRINTHGKEIDNLGKIVDRHELRIQNLEEHNSTR